MAGADATVATPSLIDSMSLQLVIPGGLLSSRARLRFTNRAATLQQWRGDLQPAIRCYHKPP